ncbi:MAG: quercetin dioxygenase-like cupin family protein [Myxococcota bacterium]|jgi:quercetin dioxygenase-like cupin family protein
MRPIVSLLLTVLLATSGACASTDQAKCVSAADDHHRQPAATETAPPAAAPRGTAYAIAAGESVKPVSPHLVRDDANVKIVVVTLQAGATMSAHAASVPVTVQTLSGAGSMTIAGEDYALAPGTVFHMDAGASHALAASKEGPLAVLVHYLKGARAAH